MIHTITLALLLTSSLALADGTGTKAPGACNQVLQACVTAGFVKGEAKKGSGLWADCIGPIMKGEAQPKKAIIKLPAVDPAVVADCKAKRPNFGMGTAKKPAK